MKATLRMILECNGVMYYDVVQYNLTFQTFKSYMMSFAELYNFCKETESTDRDFGIEDAMLKCNPILRKVSVDEKTLETIRSCDEMECTTTLEGGSLYKLLKFGLENNCLIVDDDKKSWDNSYQVTFFRNIHFSSTTMTIYARMYNEQGLYNKMIVTMNKNDGRLVFHPFVVAAPDGVSLDFWCERLNQSVTFNNVKYELWKTEYLSLGCVVPLANGAINQAAFYAVKYTDGVNICTDYLKSVTDRLDDSATVWSGGETSYAFNYGVYIKSSTTTLSRKTRSMLLSKANTLADVNGTVKVTSNLAQVKFASALINSIGVSGPINFGASVAAKIFYNSENTAERIAIATSLLHQFATMVFYTKMYLYEVRAYSYLQRYSLVKSTAPQIVGGNTKEFATITTFFN